MLAAFCCVSGNHAGDTDAVDITSVSLVNGSGFWSPAHRSGWLPTPRHHGIPTRWVMSLLNAWQPAWKSLKKQKQKQKQKQKRKHRCTSPSSHHGEGAERFVSATPPEEPLASADQTTHSVYAADERPGGWMAFLADSGPGPAEGSTGAARTEHQSGLLENWQASSNHWKERETPPRRFLTVLQLALATQVVRGKSAPVGVSSHLACAGRCNRLFDLANGSWCRSWAWTSNWVLGRGRASKSSSREMHEYVVRGTWSKGHSEHREHREHWIAQVDGKQCTEIKNRSPQTWGRRRGEIKPRGHLRGAFQDPRPDRREVLSSTAGPSAVYLEASTNQLLGGHPGHPEDAMAAPLTDMHTSLANLANPATLCL
ncbi:hypothetical protein HYFRA_00008707 [Hymenoscyphus fraxineus]|uniref:Uncharacterized protein n=1 Tax=Hymenoscyphus fraxineus TaxID=746836 RepID=A0A9N9KXV1_9HELO|nr:hypothetical protein HYFRA_00008707 [Hymenoscyphus fraxineus]